MTRIERLTKRILANDDGEQLLEMLLKATFHETPINTQDTNAYLIIEGKRQLIRDLITLIQVPDDE